MTMDTQWIGRRIRALGLTQRFLAVQLGITPAALNHKLHNRRPTTLQEAACLARWLQLTDSELRTHFLGQKVA